MQNDVSKMFLLSKATTECTQKNKKLVVKVTLSPSCSNLFDKELYKQGHNKPRKYDIWGFLLFSFAGIPITS